MEGTFRTTVNAPQLPFNIGYNTPTLMIGSCFTENIGEKMSERKLPVSINPFGVVYNPLSTELVLKRIIEREAYAQKDLITHNNLWLSLDHHTSFSMESKLECIDKINNSLKEANDFWLKTNCLIVTFGTARVYSYKKTGRIVANCHKIPAREFTHSLLSVDEIVERWSQLLNSILKNRPNLKILFTVSPVRHWKDGAIGNQISKSTLILAINKLTELFSSNAYYFPAYEIMMDDLRDYRFYASDMLHPSSVAVDYIWQKFSESSFDTNTIRLSREIEKIIQAVNHRPFNSNTQEFKQFVTNTISKIDALKRQNPDLNFDEEITALNKKVNN